MDSINNQASRLDRFGLRTQARHRTRSSLVIIIGLLSSLTYLYALLGQDLREHTIEFLFVFFAAFILYGFATTLVLKLRERSGDWVLYVIFGCALIFNALLIYTRPTLSDDMYRYIWDGRVQAQGFSPYRFAPDAVELMDLRDSQIWQFINRKSVVTVYPPAAEFVYAVLWRIRPDSVRWFQVFIAGMGLLAGALLLGLLRDLHRSSSRVLIYLWSPLLIYETAHAAHIDGLLLPLLVGAWWARVRERDGFVGVLLGFATAIKFYPALLLPALWRPNHPRGRWQMPLMFIATLVLSYLPYLVRSGTEVIGFLPGYARERFNISPPLMWLMNNLAAWLNLDPGTRYSDAQRILAVFTLGLLILVGLIMTLRPAKDGQQAVRRCIWPIGIFTLLNPNLFSWYMLWLLPLVAIFMDVGELRLPSLSNAYRPGWLALPRLDAWTGWWLFCGLVALSYTFFIHWETIRWVRRVQFWPLYALLVIDLLRWFRQPGSLNQRLRAKLLIGGTE